MSEPGAIDIMAIVVIPLEEELMEALSEVLVSIAMLELGGAFGSEEDESLAGIIFAIEGIESTVALIIESSIFIMVIESIAIAAGLMT